MQDEPTLSRFLQVHDDTSPAAILCKIAQIKRDQSDRIPAVSRSGFGRKLKVSNSDQLFF